MLTRDVEATEAATGESHLEELADSQSRSPLHTQPVSTSTPPSSSAAAALRGDHSENEGYEGERSSHSSSTHGPKLRGGAPPTRAAAQNNEYAITSTVSRFSCLQGCDIGELLSCAIVEFIGTFFLVLTVPLSASETPEMAAISIGFMLMSMVFSFGYISGGHLNPMVTFAVWMNSPHGDEPGAFNKRRVMLYVISQMAGGVVAVLYCMLIHGREFDVPNMGLSFPQMLRGFLAETLFTFVLCSVVLHVAISKQKNNNFYGLAIGFAVVCGGLAVGPVSGGAFNPAVATPLIVLRCIFSLNSTSCIPMASLWVYWASEAVGAVTASVMYAAIQNIDDEEQPR